MYDIYSIDWKASLKAKTPIKTTTRYGPILERLLRTMLTAGLIRSTDRSISKKRNQRKNEVQASSSQ